MERTFGTITVSFSSVSLILLGGFGAFWFLRSYYLQEKPRYSKKTTIAYSMVGVLVMAVGFLQLLNILNQPLADAVVWMVACLLPIQEILLNIFGPSPHPPRTRMVLAAVYGVVLILMVTLSYLFVLDAYRH